MLKPKQGEGGVAKVYIIEFANGTFLQLPYCGFTVKELEVKLQELIDNEKYEEAADVKAILDKQVNAFH